MKKKHSFLRSISFLLILSLCVEQIAYASPDPAPYKIDLFLKPKADLGLPESVASVDDSYRSASDLKTLYLIQDAHTNTSGQRNLAKTLDILFKKDKKLKYVFVEAGFGDNSLSFLRRYGTPDERRMIAEPFLRSGELHGEEYLDLTASHDFYVWGVEDWELYKRSIEDYRAVAGEREKFSDYLARIQASLDTLKPRVYNPLLLALDAAQEKFRKEELSLTAYADLLETHGGALRTDLHAYAALKNLKNLRKKENSIDFKKANEEQSRLLLSLSAHDQNELLELAQKVKGPSKLSGEDAEEEKSYYDLLGEKAGKEIANYPELFKYLAYLRAAKMIRASEVLSEITNLEREIFSKAAVTQDEKILVRAQSASRLLGKLLRLSLTPDEYKEYKALTRDFEIARMTGFLNQKIMRMKSYYDRALFLEPGYEEIVGHAEAFYESTYSRDKNFIQKALAKMGDESQERAVMITGGFHSPNLKSLLKNEDVSYVSITPKILHETNQKRYEDILLSQRASMAAAVIGASSGAPASADRTLTAAAQFMVWEQSGRSSTVLGRYLSSAREAGLIPSTDDPLTKASWAKNLRTTALSEPARDKRQPVSEEPGARLAAEFEPVDSDGLSETQILTNLAAEKEARTDDLMTALFHNWEDMGVKIKRLRDEVIGKLPYVQPALRYQFNLALRNLVREEEMRAGGELEALNERVDEIYIYHYAAELSFLTGAKPSDQDGAVLDAMRRRGPPVFFQRPQDDFDPQRVGQLNSIFNDFLDNLKHVYPETALIFARVDDDPRYPDHFQIIVRDGGITSNAKNIQNSIFGEWQEENRFHAYYNTIDRVVRNVLGGEYTIEYTVRRPGGDVKPAGERLSDKRSIARYFSGTFGKLPWVRSVFIFFRNRLGWRWVGQPYVERTERALRAGETGAKITLFIPKKSLMRQGARMAKYGKDQGPDWWEPKFWMRLDRVVALVFAAAIAAMIVSAASSYFDKAAGDINKALDKNKAAQPKAKGARLAEEKKPALNPLQKVVAHPWFLAGFSLTLMTAMGYFFGPIAFFVSLNPFILIGLTGLIQDAAGVNSSGSIFFVGRFEDLPEGAEYPTATIAIPFFKEPIETVMETVLQAKKAVDHYNAQAGAVKANLVIFEDGLQVIGPEERDARIEFYKRNGVSYIARPPNKAGVYTRTGMFKKASNLNNGHRLDREIRRRMSEGGLSAEAALNELMTGPVDPETRDDLLQTHGNILLGDMILYLDNDSYTPVEGLTASVHAMLRRPNAGFIQHVSAPLNPTHNLLTRVHAVAARSFWRFTMKIRSLYAPASILGHNLLVRKAALDEVMDEAVEPAPWHEGRGADDIVTGIAIRNAKSHYYGVLADLPFDDGGFKEGLPQSYTEIAGQLRRYGSTATGSIFNPITEWWSKGVFRPEYWNLLQSRGAEETPVTLGEKFDLFFWAMGGLQATFLLLLPAYFIGLAVLKGFAMGPALVMGALIGAIVPVVLTVYFLYRSPVSQRSEFINTFIYAPFLYFCLTIYFGIGTVYDMFLAKAKVYRSTAIGDLKDDSYLTAVKASWDANKTQVLTGAALLAGGVALLAAFPASAPLWMLASFIFFIAAALIVSPFLYEQKPSAMDPGSARAAAQFRMPSFVRASLYPLLLFILTMFVAPQSLNRVEKSDENKDVKIQKMAGNEGVVFESEKFIIHRTARGYYFFDKGRERDHFEIIGAGADVPEGYRWEFFLRHGVASYNPETKIAVPVPGVWLSTKSPFPPDKNLMFLTQLKNRVTEAQKVLPGNPGIEDAVLHIENAINVQQRKPKRIGAEVKSPDNTGARMAEEKGKNDDLTPYEAPDVRTLAARRPVTVLIVLAAVFLSGMAMPLIGAHPVFHILLTAGPAVYFAYAFLGFGRKPAISRESIDQAYDSLAGSGVRDPSVPAGSTSVKAPSDQIAVTKEDGDDRVTEGSVETNDGARLAVPQKKFLDALSVLEPISQSLSLEIARRIEEDPIVISEPSGKWGAIQARLVVDRSSSMFRPGQGFAIRIFAELTDEVSAAQEADRLTYREQVRRLRESPRERKDKYVPRKGDAFQIMITGGEVTISSLPDKKEIKTLVAEILEMQSGPLTGDIRPKSLRVKVDSLRLPVILRLKDIFGSLGIPLIASMSRSQRTLKNPDDARQRRLNYQDPYDALGWHIIEMYFNTEANRETFRVPPDFEERISRVPEGSRLAADVPAETAGPSRETLESVLSAPEQDAVMDFLQRVFSALRRSGRIAVGDLVYRMEEDASGRLVIRDAAEHTILTTRDFRKIEKEADILSPAGYQMSPADLRVIFQDAFGKAALVHMPDPSKKVEGVLDLDKMISKDMKGFEQIILPLLLIELEGLYKKEDGGQNSKIFLKTEDTALREMISGAVTASKKEFLTSFVYFDENEIPAEYRRAKVHITTPGNARSGLRNFFVQPLKEGSIPNFRAMFRLSLAIARVDKLEAGEPDFQTFTHDLQTFLKRVIDDPAGLAQAIMGFSSDESPYALPPIVSLDVAALIQGARLAKKMAEQSA